MSAPGATRLRESMTSESRMPRVPRDESERRDGLRRARACAIWATANLRPVVDASQSIRIEPQSIDGYGVRSGALLAWESKIAHRRY